MPWGYDGKTNMVPDSTKSLDQWGARHIIPACSVRKLWAERVSFSPGLGSVSYSKIWNMRVSCFTPRWCDRRGGGWVQMSLSPGETSIKARRRDSPATMKQFFVAEWVSIAVNYQEWARRGYPSIGLKWKRSQWLPRPLVRSTQSTLHTFSMASCIDVTLVTIR